MVKIVLLTGASGGIGLNIIKQLSKQNNLIIYAAARRLDIIKEQKLPNIIPIFMEMLDKDSIKKAVNTINEKHGGIDILINNSGYGLYGSLENINIDDAKKQFDVNLFGLAYLIQLVLPYMRQKRDGLIVNMSSVAGRTGMGFGVWYHSSKYAVEGLSESLAFEMSSFNVKVCIIEPGPILTKWWDGAMDGLLYNSRFTEYENYATNIAGIAKRLKNTILFSQPSLVADAVEHEVLRYINGKNVKKRRIVGIGAKIILLSKLIFPERIFDFFVKKIFFN